MKESRRILSWLGVLFAGIAGQSGRGESPPAEPYHLERVEFVSRIATPHRWGLDFVKQGNYLYCTGSESCRKFFVVDVSDPRNMKVVAENEAGLYAARNLCLHDNTVLVTLYDWITAIDVSNPTQPEMLLGCPWQVTPREVWGAAAPRPLYRCLWPGQHLFVACSVPKLALRVFEVSGIFLPRLIATVNLADRIDAASQRTMRTQQNWYPNAEIVGDDRALHTSFGQTLAGFDVSNPTHPKVLYCQSLNGNIVGLTLNQKTLYVAMNDRLTDERHRPLAERAEVAVVDLSDPATPHVVGEYQGMRLPERMVVKGSLLYLVGEETTPDGEKLLDGVPFTRGIATKYETRMALHVLDVSQPDRMRKISSLPFPLRTTYYADAACRAMVLDGRVLYVADQDYGIHAVDVGDPRQPRLLGSLRTVSREVMKIIPDDKRIYIVNQNCVTAADVSDPQRPVLDVEGSLTAISRWPVQRAPVFGPNPRYLYSVNRGAYEIAVADFGEPRAERGKVVGLVPMPEGWGARDLGWAQGKLWVLGTKEDDWASGQLLAFEPQDAGKSLKLAGSYPLGTFKRTIGWVIGTNFLVRDDRVFVLNSAMERKKLANGSQPVETAATDLVTVDINNPQAPVVYPAVDLSNRDEGIKATYQSGCALAYRDGHLFFYALNEQTKSDLPGRKWGRQMESYLLVYDLRNPGHPQLVGKLLDPGGTRASYTWRSLSFMEETPFLACTSEATGAWIVDIRDPRNPRTTWKQPFTARGAEIQYHDMKAKGVAAYQNGYLYVPRLDCVDIYRMHYREGLPPSREDRLARVRFTTAALKEQASHGQMSVAVRSALGVRAREIECHFETGDVQAAEELAREAMSWASQPQTLAMPRPIARAKRASAPLEIDGRAREWNSVDKTPFGRGSAWAKWQWDRDYLYVLLQVPDAAIEQQPGPMYTPHCHTQDHVDVFVSALPTRTQRTYGPLDTHFSVALSGRMEAHGQNPRFAGGKPWDTAYWSTTATPKLSRAAVTVDSHGYSMEIALAHKETWIDPTAGARVACSLVVIDHGQRPMLLGPAGVQGYLQVQPTWPIIELAP